MERILRIFSRESGSINQAALLLGSFAFFSQILGLFRDRALAHFIGPSPLLDAYYAAFRIPDFIFISIASLASVTVLIPFIVEKSRGENISDEAKKFLNDIFAVFLTAIVGVSVIVFFLMPHLTSLVAPGFSLSMPST